jgi:hypothetical protein
MTHQASRRIVAALLLVAAVSTATSLQAASDTPRTGSLTPACAQHDLRAFALIEARNASADTPAERLADAGLKFLQARVLCLSGQENEGVALYQSIIDLDAPVLNAGKATGGARQ